MTIYPDKVGSIYCCKIRRVGSRSAIYYPRIMDKDLSLVGGDLLSIRLKRISDGKVERHVVTVVSGRVVDDCACYSELAETEYAISDYVYCQADRTDIMAWFNAAGAVGLTGTAPKRPYTRKKIEVQSEEVTA